MSISTANIKRVSPTCIHTDQELKRELRQIGERKPKYLFRMWHKNSGGSPELNSKERITPHAFNHACGHRSIYHFEKSTLNIMILNHLKGDKTFSTEFSSWAASPHFVFNYAAMHIYRQKAADPSETYISILDTALLPERNSTYYVPLLQLLADDEREIKLYEKCHAEYLIHGVVDGAGYKTVSFQKMCSRGLIDQFPWYKPRWWINAFDQESKGHLSQGIVPIARFEVDKLQKIANLFGSRFKVPMLIALICLHKRDDEFWANITPADVAVVADALTDAKIEHHLPKGEWTFTPLDVYMVKYEDVMQMIRLAEALYLRVFGEPTSPHILRETGGEQMNHNLIPQREEAAARGQQNLPQLARATEPGASVPAKMSPSAQTFPVVHKTAGTNTAPITATSNALTKRTVKPTLPLQYSQTAESLPLPPKNPNAIQNTHDSPSRNTQLPSAKSDPRVAMPQSLLESFRQARSKEVVSTA